MNNMDKKTRIILWVVLALILAGVADFYIYKNESSSKKESPNTSSITKKGNVVLDVSNTGTTTQNKKGYKIEVIPPSAYPNTPKIPVPDLNRKLSLGGNISTDAKNIITKKINSIVASLKKNSNSVQDWIDLGVYRKIAGDYVGASEAWEYVSVLSPQNSLSFRDLGDLYGYYLKEPKKAEKNFLQAIKNNPSQIEYYFKTVAFYVNVMKDIPKARDIVNQGIKSNPSAKELKTLLSSIK